MTVIDSGYMLFLEPEGFIYTGFFWPNVFYTDWNVHVKVYWKYSAHVIWISSFYVQSVWTNKNLLDGKTK